MVDEDSRELADRKGGVRRAALCHETTSSRAPWMLPSTTPGCTTRPGGPRPHGSPPISLTLPAWKRPKRVGRSRNLGKLFSDAYPHRDAETAYGSKRVSESEIVDDPEDPQRWSSTCKRRPAAASECSSVVRPGDDPRKRPQLAVGRQTQGRPAAGPASPRRRRPVVECAHGLSRLPDDGGTAHHDHSRDPGTSCAITKGSPTPDAWLGGVFDRLAPEGAAARAPGSVRHRRARGSSTRSRVKGRCASPACRRYRRLDRGQPAV